MPLATEEEWENDPELREMRREFVASFAGRRQAIETLSPALLRESEAFQEALRGVVFIAHKLSGAAETYGFPTLTLVCTAFEDCFGRSEPRLHEQDFVVQSAQLLVDVLARAEKLSKDSRDFSTDPRLLRLRKAVRAAD